ncbi:bifunctional glycosyltransferase family 2/GtrA family protein [Clostridium sp. 1001271B_151109_B4]|uniref:bifunctional glycosyltransferase family 2/GtrA family protein n=1 Tax=Clostridium sp. 1001271B_151109_B4 TaxID=2787148 RepID=UPI0018A8A2CF|nr:bifunctional glycosyltransferase family 2/GtrA family protein [Clostridium sp. 1001271B_151109_B4]
MDNLVLIIPTLEPNTTFIKIVCNYKKHFNKIIVVDDGSGEEYRDIFKEIRDMGIVVLTHALNYGKGRALKTAFNYVLNNYKDVIGVITVDSDGQHLVKDALKCSQELINSENKLVLGSRNFDEDNVPLKSRVGNKLTRSLFKILCGISISDTQTGLRAIAINDIKRFLYTKGERFEYETNMLLDAKKYNIKFEEVPIETVYLNENKGTHFNPLRDSVEIYKVFIKYLFVSLSSFLVDILFFMLFLNILSLFSDFSFIMYKIIVSTVCARIISSLYNYLLNRKFVFEQHDSKSFIIKYYILVIIQMGISSLSVASLSQIFSSKIIVLLKIIVDILIFIANYYIQREWVFNDKK